MPCIGREESRRMSEETALREGKAFYTGEVPVSKTNEQKIIEDMTHSLEKHTQYVIKLEGMLCSVLTHVEYEFDEEDSVKFIREADHDGESQVNSWWEAHKEEDRLRLSALISNLSSQERKTLRGLL